MLLATVEQLRALRHEQTNPAANLHQFMVRRPADREWMLDVIMTVTQGQHDYFSRTFRPDNALEAALRAEITNEDGFFTGLPFSSAPAHRNNHLGMHDEEKRRLREALAEARLQRLEAQLARQ